MSEIIHENELRGRQKKTTKQRRDDSSIIIDALGKMNDRRIKAHAAGDWQALEALARDYEAIGCSRLAGDIRRELPEEVSATELL